MLQDLRYVIRHLSRSPGYIAVVVLTLALGIAVNAQLFATFSKFYLQPRPVRDAARLTMVLEHGALFNQSHGMSFADYHDLRAGSKTLTGLVAYHNLAAHLSRPGKTPERGWIEAVTPDAFSQLGVAAHLGRVLTAKDGVEPPGQPVAVLTHRYWQSHFGGDAGVVGQTIVINGQPFTVVGVAQPGFNSCAWALGVALFVPTGSLAQLHNGTQLFTDRAAKAWRVLAYLAPGATLANANAELAVFARRLAADFPREHRGSIFQAVPELRTRPDPTVAQHMPAVFAIFACLAALVLFIACANVANLMGAHALDREKELVVRSALGAPRARLLRQLLTESTLLALAAGTLGHVLSIWAGDWLAHFLPTNNTPVFRDQAAGWTACAFTVGLALAAGFLAGIVPALRASRVDLVQGIKQGTASHSGGRRHRLRNFFVVVQVASSCVLLVGALLFLRSLLRASEQPLGFKPDRLLFASFNLDLQRYDAARGSQFHDALRTRVRALPGVESVGTTQHVPFGYNIPMREIWPESPTAHVPDGHRSVLGTVVSPDFTRMFGVPLLHGRELAETDGADTPRVALINETMARTFWPGHEALGRRFRLSPDGPAIEVVGITATGRYSTIAEPPTPYFYLPQGQHYVMPTTLVVRAARAPGTLIAGVRDAVNALDPHLPLYEAATIEQHMNSSIFALMPLRAGTVLAAAQGAIGLLLAALGLYAVVAYDVGRRTREIGIRMALGATSGSVLGQVARSGLVLTGLGLALGLALSLALSSALARVLFGLRPLDLTALGAVGILLSAVAALSCLVPARRATRVDPMAALRAE